MSTFIRMLLLITVPVFCHAKTPGVVTQKMQNAALLFTENRGQVTDAKGLPRPDILFTAHSGGARVFISATGISYQFTNTRYQERYERTEHIGHTCMKQQALRTQIKTATHRFSLSLKGANLTPAIRREFQNEYYENFYLANCPDGVTGVPTYGKVVMENVYPGIDWVLYSNGSGLKYDFVVKPGAHPSEIKLQIGDANEVEITQEGELVIKTSLGGVREAAPTSFVNGKAIATHFVQEKDGTIGFLLDEYDNSEQLTIDPSVTWSTYYGGSGNEMGEHCTTDLVGNVYLSGNTQSYSGIAMGGFQDTVVINDWCGYLAKFNTAGTRLWGTYYNGIDANGCATDDSGNVFLGGSAVNDTGIAFNGFQNHFGGGTPGIAYDAFLAKFNASGRRSWATFYGGNQNDMGYSCTVDRSGNVYLTGATNSDTGIAINGFQDTILSNTEAAFLVKFTNQGARLWATYYEGNGAATESISSATDSHNNVYISGHTDATIGIASNGDQNVIGGGIDAFLVKFDSLGARLWGTYIGGTSTDNAAPCVTDGGDNVIVGGMTYSANNIAMNGFQNNKGYNASVFLVKYAADGVKKWGTYYGSDLSSESCAVDHNGNIYVCGTTDSAYNIAANGFQDTLNGGTDAFIAKFTPKGVRVWGTFFGSYDYEFDATCALDNAGNIYMAGETSSTSGIASGGHQNTFGGLFYDSFLVKISDPVENAVTALPNSFENFTLYPNPNSGSCSVQFRVSQIATNTPFRLEVSDISGNIRWRKTLDKIVCGNNLVPIVLNNLATGVYFIKLSSGQSTLVQKFELE